jgi:hypothetical protein
MAAMVARLGAMARTEPKEVVMAKSFRQVLEALVNERIAD